MSKKRHKTSHCPNCGFHFKSDILLANYCPNCGQENHLPVQSVSYYIKELVESFFHFDNRSWRSFRMLIQQPGRITRDYLDNKRARYNAPSKMFFLSLFWFLLMFELINLEISKRDSNNQEKISLNKLSLSLLDTIPFPNPAFRGDQIGYTGQELKNLKDYAIVPGRFQKTSPYLNFMFATQAKLIRFSLKHGQSMNEFENMVTRISHVLILFMIPIGSFVTWIFFYRKGLTYYATLMLNIHLNIFILLITAFVLLVIFIVNIAFHPDLKFFKETSSILAGITILSFILNALPAYKYFFMRSWKSTIIRGILISCTTFILFPVLFSIMIRIMIYLQEQVFTYLE